jgi:large subunit ribosomal protein L30
MKTMKTAKTRKTASSATTPRTRGVEPRPGGRLLVRQVRSGIGFEENQKATLRALGLERIGRERILPDTRQTRGMVATIPHLLQVEELGPEE